LRCVPSHGLSLLVTRVGVMLRNVVVQEGDIQVTIPYKRYAEVLTYLEAIQSSLEPEELISSILQGWVKRLNL